MLWNASEGGYEAWDTFLSFERELGTGVAGVYENDQDGFLAGEVCFHLDGSFRLGNIASNAPDLNFGVVELPEHNGVKSTFGSYWTHGITTKAAADPARDAAAIKFLKFITTPEAGKLWVGIVGELPAQLEAANDPSCSPIRNWAPLPPACRMRSPPSSWTRAKTARLSSTPTTPSC